MSFLPLKIPPGIYRNGTNYQASGRWYEANLMRWVNGTIRPFGGWVKAVATSLGGPGRGMLAWRPSSFLRLAAIGTPDGLKLWNDDIISTITPTVFPAGVVDTFYGVGYGFGDYGEGNYGEASGSGATEATTWSFDTWGDNLVAVASHHGVIVESTGAVGVPAAPVTNAPTAKSLFVTDERILVALGADGDLRKVQWCDVEDNTDWTPAADNQAGDKLIQTNGALVRGVKVRGTNLILTTVGAHTMTYLGPPYIYGFDHIADQCGLPSPLAIQTYDGKAMWMGRHNFFRYDGAVSPVPCDIHDYIFKDINFLQAAKFSAGSISAHGEILFFYASAGSNTNNRCVSYNTWEGHWNIVGALPRGCWFDEGAFRNPLAAGEDGYLYTQESGWTADGAALTTARYALSGPVEIGRGDRVMDVHQVIPDELTAGHAEFWFASQFTPEGPVYDQGPYPTSAYTDARITGRQMGIKIRSLADEDFRIGIPRLDATMGSGR